MEFFRFILFFGLFLVSSIYAQDYNVRDFGAVGDGVTDDTNAVRNATAAAAKTNGGRIIFDFNYSFLTGSFALHSNVVLDVRGTILGFNSSDGYSLPGYNSNTTWEPLIQANYAQNITISGGGTIDGRGQIWWPCWMNTDPPCGNKIRPTLIAFWNVSNTVLANITLQNSPMYNFRLAKGENLHVYNIRILNPNLFGENPSHNTDGINLGGVTNVLIENSYISTGDDTVAIDSFCGDVTSKNIMVRNITVGTTTGLSIGSFTCAGISNVTFQDITMNGSLDGIYLKSRPGRGGLVENITYKNIHMYNVSNCFRLTMNYSDDGMTVNVTYDIPSFRNINISNVTCDHASHGYLLEGMPDSEMNINFENIRVTNYTHLVSICHDIYGSCNNATVFPYCPPCIDSQMCVDTNTDCNQYLSFCNNPTYHNLLCGQCRKTCNLCSSCN